MWFLLFVINSLIVIILTLYVNFAQSFTKFKRRLDFSHTIPGPTIREVLTNAQKGRVLPWLRGLREKYGPIFQVWLGRDLFLFLSDPEDVKAILSNNQLLYKSRNYELVKPWLGKGLLTNGGEAWHKRRKMLTPAFHFKILNAFRQPMEENSKILVNKLKDVADGQSSINIYPYITLFTLDIICETAMGIKKHAQLNSDSEYVQAVQTMCRVLQNQLFNFWHRFPFLYQFTSDAKQRDQALKILHGETRRVIELRKRKLKTESDINIKNIENDESFGVKKRLAFLDILLLAQKEGASITDTEIREEVDTFMFEGHDTTSSALSFIIYLLSQHSEIQAKAYEEVVQEDNQEKENLKFLEAVIKESLRLYPSVPSYSRIIHEDFKLRDLTIPEGTTVSVFAYMAHRDPGEYPDPEKFIPERFLESSKEFRPYSFVAFSAGPRNCIGQKFAMLELKCTLFNLLKNFEFLPVDGFQVKPQQHLVLKSENGFLVKLRQRSS